MDANSAGNGVPWNGIAGPNDSQPNINTNGPANIFPPGFGPYFVPNNATFYPPSQMLHTPMPPMNSYGNPFMNMPMTMPMGFPFPNAALAQPNDGVIGTRTTADTKLGQQPDECILIDRLFAGRIKGLPDLQSIESLVRRCSF